MKHILFAALVSLGAVSAFAAENVCFNNPRLPGYAEATREFFIHKNYEKFDKDFHALCKRYSAKLDCTVVEVEKMDAGQKMTELSGQSRCTETFNVNAGKTAKIYFMNDKTTVK